MSEPTRLLEVGSAASRLLRAGLRDNPEPRAAHRAAVALGLGTAAATAASASASAASGVSLAISGPAAAAAGGSVSVSLGAASLAAKWVFVGFLGGALTAGGAAAVGEATKRSEPAALPGAPPAPAVAVAVAPNARVPSSPVPARPQAAPGASAPVAPPVAQLPKLEATKVPRSSGASPAPRVAPGATLAAAPARDAEGRLGRDLTRIDETRRALRAGDPAAALAELDGYERGRETSFFDREAMLLRIEALIQRGERERASRLANEYFTRFPSDVHAPRLRALLQAK